ncbi:MAG: hypothetical protein AAGU15_05085 [Anaerolineaceae bacterium]|jgi:hypothetical protein
MTENKDLHAKSKAPVGDKPEEPVNSIDSVMFYSHLYWNDEKKRYDIEGFAQVELYTDGSAEVITVQPPEFEKFLEEYVYDVEDPYLKIVSPYSVFNQMLAAHWRQLPLMWSGTYSRFIETDEEGLDKLIEMHGWFPDEKPEDEEE